MNKPRSKNKLDSLADEFCDHWDVYDNICLDCNKDLTQDRIQEIEDYHELNEEIEEIDFSKQN